MPEQSRFRGFASATPSLVRQMTAIAPPFAGAWTREPFAAVYPGRTALAASARAGRVGMMGGMGGYPEPGALASYLAQLQAGPMR